MGIPLLVAIFVASTAISYVMSQRAMKKAKKAADDMNGVLINKESNIEPIPVIYGERRVGGVRVFVSTRDASGGDPNEFLYIALAMAEGEVESITDIHIDDNPITDSKYSGLYTINVHTGADNQTYDSLLTEANAGWTSSHKLSGVAYLAIKLKWDADVFQGVPEITAVVKGRKVYDPRTESTAWSNNPALCVRDYLTNDRYGKGIPTSAIDDDAFEDAADDCDESVTFYSGGSTGKIFECNAVLQTDETLFDNIEKMLMGCRGFLPYTQGKYGLIIDKSRSSVFAFDQETIVGGIAIAGEAKENKFNRVLVKFANPTVNYQPDQAVWPTGGSTEEAALLAEDNGTLLVEEITLETVTNYYVARDLARVILRRSRNSIRTSFNATSEALQLTVGDVVTVTHSTPGWSAKPFQVESIAMNYDGTCSVTLLEYDSTIYTYDLAQEQTDYPDTDLPDPFSVVPPTELQVSAETSVALDGTIVTAMVVSWTASTDSFVSQYDVQWSTDNSAFQSAVTDDTLYRISPVEAGATYYTRVRSINSLGVKSAFLSANQGSVGDTTAPALPTSISATAGYKSISLEWTNPSDKDFSNVVVYRATSSGGSFSEVATVGGGFGANAEFLNGGLADATTFYYKFRSVDYSGNKTVDENGDPLYTAEVSATTNAAAIAGSDGKSTYNAPIFLRKSTAPSAPTGGTFNFGSNSLSPPTNPEQWYAAVPTGTDDLYQSNFQFSIVGDTGTVTAGTWSPPRKVSGEGEDGTSSFTFNVYRRSDGEPDAPSGGEYDFTNNEIDPPTNWYADIPAVNGDPLWSSSTTAKITGATGTDSNLSWGPVSKVMQDGDTGKSVYTPFVFRRKSGTAPSRPSGGTFNFGTNDLTPPTDWYEGIPTGTDPVYSCHFTFSINGDTGTVTAGQWSPPVISNENGQDGVSTFTYSVYKRDTTTPSKPTNGSYNFTENSITAPTTPATWYEYIPTGTDPVYVSIAKAQITGPTGTDSSIVYQNPTLAFENGESITGETGPRNASGYVYYSLSQTNAPNSPTATDYDFDTGSFGGLVATGGDTGVWSRTPPTNTGGDAKYWASSYIISETEYDENPPSTITFNTPFASFQFDGLVTFTNLNSELADASSTEITTINGGLLKTGTIDVSNVNISGTASSGISIKSAASGSRMEIESDVIKIYVGAETTPRVQLGNLA